MRKVGAGLVLLLTSCSQTPGAAYREEGGTSRPVEHAFNLEALAASTTTTEPEPTTTVAPVIPSATAPARSLQPVATTPAGPLLAYGEWAIPEYIVGCETGYTYSWNAYNASSGAAGPYQLMPEWFGDDARNHSHAEQSAMAARIWNGGKGASNWAACL